MISRRRYLLLMLIGWSMVLIDGPFARAEVETIRLPTLKFFFYDEREIEWVVSTDPDLFQKHLNENPDSASLFDSLTSSVIEPADIDGLRSRMATWIDEERAKFDEAGRNAVRMRKAEGIVAYMRAHDFSVSKLVDELLKRSGAQDVELVVVHLLDDTGTSSFMLKVILPNDRIKIGKQGFNVVLGSSNVTHTSVLYALARALYEVHETINDNAGDESEQAVELEVDVLPSPDDSPPRPVETRLPHHQACWR